MRPGEARRMIEWLMQVVAVAWMGAMLITLSKVLNHNRALPPDGDERDPPRPVGHRHDVGHIPIRESLDAAVQIRFRTHAHRGNARELSTPRASTHRRRARAASLSRRPRK